MRAVAQAPDARQLEAQRELQQQSERTERKLQLQQARGGGGGGGGGGGSSQAQLLARADRARRDVDDDEDDEEEEERRRRREALPSLLARVEAISEKLRGLLGGERSVQGGRCGALPGPGSLLCAPRAAGCASLVAIHRARFRGDGSPRKRPSRAAVAATPKPSPVPCMGAWWRRRYAALEAPQGVLVTREQVAEACGAETAGALKGYQLVGINFLMVRALPAVWSRALPGAGLTHAALRPGAGARLACLAS